MKKSFITSLAILGAIVLQTIGAAVTMSAAGRSGEGQPVYSYEFKTPLKTSKLRLTSNHATRIHIPEFAAYAVNAAGYPSDPAAYKAYLQVPGLHNFVKDEGTKITVSGVFREDLGPDNIYDGSQGTRWVSQEKGEKWIVIDFGKPCEIGCIQFLNGWGNGQDWKNVLTDFRLEYWTGKKWKAIDSLN